MFRVRTLFNLLILGVTVGFSCCTKDSDCDSHLLGSISDIERFDSLKLGSALTYHIKVNGFNTCSSLEEVIAEQNGATFTISPKIYNKGCACTQSLPVFNGTYVFKPDTFGTYYLKFFNNFPAKYLTDTVVVSK